MIHERKRAHSLLIGLDGADLDVVRALGRARLPELFALMDRGVHAPLQSVTPPATLPNWSTLLTGVDPGMHGVFDFTTRRGYRVHFTAGTVRAAPTLAARLDRLGRACAMLFFPATYPPERLAHGVFVSGWDAPVAFSADASFVWPRSLHRELCARFGQQRFDDVDEFAADEPGFHERLPDALCARIERRTELALWLLERRTWDLFALYFGESDTAAHHLWPLWDERSPRRPPHVSERAREGLPRVYEALDRAVGRLVTAAGGEGVEVTLASDHGSGGSSDKIFHLNQALADGGFLRMKARTKLPALLKRAALEGLPPSVRERVFRIGRAALPGWLESRVRFGSIDMGKSVAFSEELNYFPSICYNLRGREPSGTLDPADRERLRRELESALLSLQDPWTGRPVVRALHAREELFRGPYVDRAPDLVLELELDAGYSYNLMPSQGGPVFARLPPEEHLGRKGRSLAGSHRPHGLYVAAGPSIRARGTVGARMADASATLLARMGVAPPAVGGGRVLAVLEAPADPERLPDAAVQALDGGQDEARVAARLRSLGYIE